MTRHNRDYGTPTQCEIDGCERTRGAPLRPEWTYGCVLCTKHESAVQLGEIDLPDTATQARRESAEEAILGAPEP